ncbi:MAG TPA: autotransporter-associated beta strand repeat-containing protein [Phycisphaerae bacterium]|nr:autotransporter-associated beta strand repeat-containing protein [Phycisphaerae bacterium]
MKRHFWAVSLVVWVVAVLAAPAICDTILNAPFTLTGNEQIPDGPGAGNLVINATGSLDLNGFSETVNGLVGVGAVTNGAGAGRLTFGNDNTTATFGGPIGFTGGSIGLTKIGTGTQTLTGTALTNSQLFARFGTLEVATGGSLTVNTYACIGLANGDNGSLLISGNGFVDVNGDFNSSDQAGSRGSVVLQDSARLDGNNSFVGKSANTVGTLDIRDSAAASFQRLYIGSYGTSVGVVRQSGGQITRTGSGDWRIGGGGGTGDSAAYGALLLSNGTFDTGASNFQIGAYGLGVIDQTGGTINSGQWIAIGRYSGSVGMASVTGGQFNQTGTGNRLIVAENGWGNLNVGGTGVVDAAGGLRASMGGGTAIVNLATGGTIRPVQIDDGGGMSVFNFHGGTLQARNATGAFMQGLDATYIYSEGALIDTNGFDVTIAQALLAPTGNGVSSIPVVSGGTGYLAEPIVRVTGDGVGATARAVVDGSGTITGIVITNPGTGYTTASATLLGGGGSGGSVGMVALSANASGGLTKQGNGTLTLTGANTFSGDTRVVTGTLAVNNAQALGQSTLDMNAGDAGAVTFNQASTLGGLKGSRNLDGGNQDLTVGANNTNQTYSGNLSGVPTLTKTGSGTWTLTGTSTVTHLFPRAGTLEIASGGNVTATGYSGPGLDNGDVGSLLVSGTGWVDVNGDFNVSDRAGSTGRLYIQDSAWVEGNNTWVGKSANTLGEAFQSGGTMTVNGELRLAQDGASTGHYTLSDGTLSVSSSMFVGYNGTATLGVTGGTINVTNGLMVWNGSGRIDIGQDAGKTTQVNTNWLTLGQDSGTGELNQTGGAVNLANSHLYLGYGAAATGTYNLSNGTLTINGDIRTDSGTGLFNQTGGSTTANWIRMGINGGSDGEFRVSNGTVQINNEARIGENGTGVLRLSGTAQLTDNGSLMIGYGGSGQGTAYMSDSAVLTVNGGVMRVGDAGAGTLNMTGGTINTANWFVIGQGGSQTSTVNMSGGTLNVNTNGGGERLQISVWDTARGVMNVSGTAQVNVNGSSIQVGGDHAGASGTLTLADSAVVNTPQLTVGWQGSGAVTQDGGTMNINGSHLRFGDNGSPTGTYNMNGGSLQVASDIRNDVGTAVFNQTGGTVNAQYLRMALGGGTNASYTATGGTTTITQEADFGARGTGTLTVGSTSPASFATVTLNELWLGRSRWGGGESGGTGNVRVYGDGQLIVNRLELGGSATSTINVEGGLLESRGNYDNTLVGTNSATGIVNVSGGRFTVPSGNLQVGWDSRGELNASGTGQVDVAGWWAVGRLGTGVGTVTARDSSVLNANGGALILGEDGVGTLDVYDSARVNAVNQFRVGFVNRGTANLYGGTVKTPSTVIAMNGGSTGTLNLAGGTLETANLYYGAGSGSFNWTSGTLKPGTALMNVTNPGGRLEVSQQGWTAAWYNGNEMTDANADSWNPYTLPMYLETVDAVSWSGTTWPGVYGTDGDYNGTVYQARLYVPEAGNYSFRERVDDASALYIDGTKVLWDYTGNIDSGSLTPTPWETTGNPWDIHTYTTVSLSAGWHLLDFRYSDHWGGQWAYLEWDPDGGQNWQTLDLDALGTDIGLTVIAGDYTQGPGGELALDIMGLPFGYDQLLVAGHADLAGLLTAMAGPDVRLGDRFVVLLASELSGRFDEVAGEGFSYADGYWRAIYDYQAGTVTLEATAPEPVTLGLLSLAGATLGGYIRRRRRVR